VIVTLIAQALVAGGLSGARPLLSLLVLGLITRFSTELMLPSDIAWLVHPYALVALAALSYVEHEVRDDPEMEELLRWPLGVIGAAAAVMASRLLAASAGTDGDTAAPVGVMSAVGATAASVGVQTARRHALETLDDVASVDGWFRRVEAGGVVGVLLLIWAAPIIAIGLVVVLTVGAFVTSWALRRWRTAQDARRRKPCPSCQHGIRVEASSCPNCAHGLTPSEWLT
jgi:Domain of unknown function (DUF4126)